MNFIRDLLKRKFLLIAVGLALIIGGYFGYQAIKPNEAAPQYITAPVEKGMLTVSISGTGQVSASNQLDIKTKASGDVTYLNIKNDQQVKAGTLLVQTDSRESLKAISDAEVALESAKAKLEDLLSQPDAKSRLQTENALAQSERDLDKAKENYGDIEKDAERALAEAYEDGYAEVSTTYFKLSDYLKDLKDVLGTEKSAEEYVASYKIILGSNSAFISKFLDDYYQANDIYNESYEFFRGVCRYDNRDTIYRLLEDTLKTVKEISQAVESARHMFDAIVVSSYTHLTIASHIDNMQPKIESDVSSVNSNINFLQQIINTIDDTVKETPKKIEDAKIAIQTAEEKLEEKKLDLKELNVGADPEDIKSQKYVIVQKEDALWDAKKSLAEHFVYAPFDGIITEANVKIAKGDSVSSGAVLASIITEQKIAEITLNEIDAAQAKVDQKAILQFDAAPDLSITGKVAEVDTLGAVTQGVVSYGVKIAFDVDDERIKPGMTVSASIILDSKQNILLVPLSAVKAMGDNSYVEVLANGQPQRKTVVTGSSNDTMIEIISGLEEGENVISQTISNSAAQNKTSAGGGMPGGQQTNPMQQMQRMMR